MNESSPDILQLKHCPKCDYDVRFVPEPRCPECGAELESDSFDLNAYGRDLRENQNTRRDMIIVGLIVLQAVLVSTGFSNALTSNRTLGIGVIVVFIGFIIFQLWRRQQGLPDARMHFSRNGVFVAEKSGSRQLRKWNRVRAIGLKERRRARWRITLGGYWWRLYRSSATLKFDFVADANDARRVAERLRALRNAGLHVS